MKPSKCLMLLVLLFMPLASQAQYRQDRDWNRDRDSRNLNAIAGRLSDSAQHVWTMVRDRRNDVDEQHRYLFVGLRNFARNARNWAAQINSSTPETYRSGAQQLITEAQNVGRLVDRTEMTYHLRNDWNEVEDQVYRLSQFYGIPFSTDSRTSRYYRGYGRNGDLARTDPYDRDRYGRDRDLARTDPYYRDRDYGSQSGTFRWRGRVDGSDIIYLRGSRVDIRHLQAQPIADSSFDIAVPLPQAGVNVQMRTLRGRGRVQLIQQPSPQNNYTAAVQIDDPDAGQDYYEFELIW